MAPSWSHDAILVLLRSPSAPMHQLLLERRSRRVSGRQGPLEQVKSYPQLGIEDPVEKVPLFRAGQDALGSGSPEVRSGGERREVRSLSASHPAGDSGKLEGQGTNDSSPVSTVRPSRFASSRRAIGFRSGRGDADERRVRLTFRAKPGSRSTARDDLFITLLRFRCGEVPPRTERITLTLADVEQH
jgi:hypothetical protein